MVFFIYLSRQKYWKRLPSLSYQRSDHSCGLVRRPSGDVEIVVAGGVREVTLEIFNFRSQTWRRGKFKFIF